MLLIRTSPDFAEEKAYSCAVLLGEILGLPFKMDFIPGTKHYQFILPNGFQLIVEDHFWGRQKNNNYLLASNIPVAAFTFKNPMAGQADLLVGVYGRDFFLKENNSIHCGIDLMASAFFMLTRWEEYVRPERDQFDRFPAEQALSVRDNFLHRPVVNEYAHFLGQLLQLGGGQLTRKVRRYNLHLSHDVDHPLLWWSAGGRIRTLAGSALKRKSGKETWWWLRNHIFKRPDPFDVFEEWMDLYEQYNLKASFNFLGERPENVDCYYPLQHPFISRLLQKIHRRGHQIGFHPSREAYADAAVFTQELRSLRAVSPQAVTSGRQHYLCFSAPETWQRWADSGLESDSTLGYSEAPGFRCGICQPFPVFNFLSKKTLPLYERPLIAMDVTLALYQKRSPEQALQDLFQLNDQVKKYGGEFVLLWHNSSWNSYFWAPWRGVYRQFIQNAHQG